MRSWPDRQPDVSVARPRDGRGWRGIVRQGRTYVSSRTFPTKKEALAYVAAEKARLAGGAGKIDPGAARQRIVDLLPVFLAHRVATVAEKTVKTERHLLCRVTPEPMLRRSVGSVTSRDVETVLTGMLATGSAYGSMRRYRDALRAFFAWSMREGMRVDNPVAGAVVPRRTAPAHEMQPWSHDDLRVQYEAWAILNADAAEIARFLGLTGLRWSEARALIVADVSLVPYPSVLVQRARPEGTSVRTTKNGTHRRVPLAEPVLPFVRARMVGREPRDLLMPPMHRGRFTRQLHWDETAGGRTIHDLRHTAITGWLSAGIDLPTVRTWAGHSTLAITSRYVHHVGSAADVTALARLNTRLKDGVSSGGTPINKDERRTRDA